MFWAVRNICFVILFLSLISCYAQIHQSEVINKLPSPFQLTSKTKNSYAQLNLLKELEAIYEISNQQNTFYEAFATAYSFVGQYDNALEVFDKLSWAKKFSGNPDSAKLDSFIPTNSIDLIDSLSGLTQAVFINEAHHYPAHRSFVIKLLKRLKLKGYKYFAVETINRLDTLLNKRKYPLLRETGYYTKEPVFGELIRQAILNDFVIVPFDYEGEYKLENREKGQAKNIVNRILKSDSSAKILLLTGYTHIREKSTGAQEKMMAQYFKEITGIDPLTIEQTLMSEHSGHDFEFPEYKYADKKGLITDYVSFSKNDGTIFSAEYGDVTVFHPRTKRINLRPHWLNFNNLKYSYQLPDEVMQFQKPFLVKVFNFTEGIKSVPVDIVEVTEAGVPPLLLAEGKFIVRFIRRWDSEPFLEFNINVE